MNYYDLQRISIQLMTVSTVVFGLTGVGAILVNIPRTVVTTSSAKEPVLKKLTNCQKRMTIEQTDGGVSINVHQSAQTESEDLLTQDSIISSSVAFRCVALKVYKVSGSSWIPLEETNVLVSNESVGFGVIGGTTSGIIDKSRFRVLFGDEYTSWTEVTDVNTFGEFFSVFELPQVSGDMQIEAQLHHSTLGWN